MVVHGARLQAWALWKSLCPLRPAALRHLAFELFAPVLALVVVRYCASG
jgi:hypothetical protein